MLEGAPGVASACVFGLPDETWGELVAVAVVPAGDAPSAPGALEHLKPFLAERLASHKRPRLLAHLERLPLSPSGKVDRRATAEAAMSRLRPL